MFSAEAVTRTCSVEKVFLEACNFTEKETLAHVFSYEFCEISNNTFFTEQLRWLLLFLAKDKHDINHDMIFVNQSDNCEYDANVLLICCYLNFRIT